MKHLLKSFVITTLGFILVFVTCIAMGEHDLAYIFQGALLVSLGLHVGCLCIAAAIDIHNTLYTRRNHAN